MEVVYEQDCGSYTTTLSPSYPFLTLESTGATAGPHSHSYHDKLTLASNDLSDVGQYSVTMTVSQDSSNGDGFSNPYVGYIPSVDYTFLVTVNPCDTTLSAN